MCFPAPWLSAISCFRPARFTRSAFLSQTSSAAAFTISGLPFPSGFPVNWPRTLSAGGDKRDRTVDLLLAKQALSQLSYTPILRSYSTVWSFSSSHLLKILMLYPGAAKSCPASQRYFPPLFPTAGRASKLSLGPSKLNNDSEKIVP